MKLTVATKCCTKKLEASLQERMGILEQRFEEYITQISVHLADEPSLVGSDQVCTIDIKIAPRGLLHVRAKHPDLHAAMVNACRGAESMILQATGTPYHALQRQDNNEYVSATFPQEMCQLDVDDQPLASPSI